MQTGYFFVEFFRQDINLVFIFIFVRPQINLCQCLIRERVRHYKTWMASCAAEIYQTTFGQHVNRIAVFESVLVDLRFDVELDGIRSIQALDLDFIVEVTNVADDGLILHALHMFQRQHVFVAGSSDVNIAAAHCCFNGIDFKAFHRGLQCIDRIDLGDDNAAAIGTQRMRRTLADIAITANDRDFAGQHDVHCAFQAIGQAFAATIQIIEL